MNPIPQEWLSKVKPGAVRGIVNHWTAGQHYPSQFDKQHYHFLIDKDGKVHRGTHTIAQNAPIRGDYAAHTRNWNGGIIGVSLCCLGGHGVSERNQGPWPMTKAQWDTMCAVNAQLATHYGFPIQRPTKADPRGIQSHAEVESNLGIPQAGKWDFTVCHDPKLRGARVIGDAFRSQAKHIQEASSPVPLMSDDRDDVSAVYPNDMPVRQDEELPTTNRQEVEPLSPFRKVIGWVTAGATTITTALAGFGSYLSMIDWRVWIGFIIAAGFFGTIIFSLIWLFPRPVVLPKEPEQ
jgi:hypothetical protein